MIKPDANPIYIFIDESGDFNFSKKGSTFYTVSAVLTNSPWEKADEIAKLRYELLTDIHSSYGLNEDYLENKLFDKFHATEDRQIVRDKFFKVICSMTNITAHSIVVRKNRTNPSIQDPNRFYSKILGSLMNYVFKSYIFSMLCIFVDGVPASKGKKAFEGAIKSEIKLKCPGIPFCIYHPPSASSSYLQVVDYINWAIFRKWENNDLRSYDLIKGLLGRPELDYFRNGWVDYY